MLHAAPFNVPDCNTQLCSLSQLLWQRCLSECHSQFKFCFTGRRAHRTHCRSSCISCASPSHQQTITKQAIALAASGAVLGPLCDGQHSKYGVLHYTRPTIIELPLQGPLETCWWVPALFALAAVIIGFGHSQLPRLIPTQQQSTTPVHGEQPSWAIVMTGISAFVLQYAASGAFEEALGQHAVLGLPALDMLLLSTSVLHWYTFDRSRQGFFMACLTATAGPVAELVLINQLNLYHYSHPVWWGIPSWIPWVYFCGSPAVGNLGRKIRTTLQSQALL